MRLCIRSHIVAALWLQMVLEEEEEEAEEEDNYYGDDDETILSVYCTVFLYSFILYFFFLTSRCFQSLWTGFGVIDMVQTPDMTHCARGVRASRCVIICVA